MARLMFGSIDFQLDMHIEDDDEALRSFRAMKAARGAALAVDGKIVDAPVLARALRLLAVGRRP